VLTDYIRAAMQRASYEILEDGTHYGEVLGLQGVYANDPNLEACRTELESTLEGWILFGLTNGLPIPPLDGIDLTVPRVA
jgi:hypothetical protein